MFTTGVVIASVAILLPSLSPVSDEKKRKSRKGIIKKEKKGIVKRKGMDSRSGTVPAWTARLASEPSRLRSACTTADGCATLALGIALTSAAAGVGAAGGAV